MVAATKTKTPNIVAMIPFGPNLPLTGLKVVIVWPSGGGAPAGGTNSSIITGWFPAVGSTGAAAGILEVTAGIGGDGSAWIGVGIAGIGLMPPSPYEVSTGGLELVWLF